jgi:hypothetical protein
VEKLKKKERERERKKGRGPRGKRYPTDMKYMIVLSPECPVKVYIHWSQSEVVLC